VTNSPWPISATLLRQEQTVSGIFLVFVVSIAFALLPASIISYITHEKETNLKH